MPKSTRSFWLEYVSQNSSGAYFGAFLVWFSRGNEWLMLFWVVLFVVVNAVSSYLNRRSNTYEAIKERMDERMDALRFRGVISPEGLTSDEDIKRLKAAGEDDFAAIFYQTLHATTLREARRAVKKL